MSSSLCFKSLVLAVLAAGAIATPSLAQQNPWRDMARTDLDFADRFVRAQYITAVYPDPAPFAAKIAAARKTADEQLRLVKDFAGYNALLQRFINGLDDEHLSIRPSITRSGLSWPGFLLAYQGRRYITAAAGVPGAPPNGSEVTTCDGQPIARWVDRITPYEGGHPGLESTKAIAAHALLVDKGNPFAARPLRCTIAGKDTVLQWQTLGLGQYLAVPGGLASSVKVETTVTPFGHNGAWVRLGLFQMQTEAQAAQFRAVVAQAASLRTKSVIVLDVRGNRGGNYNWFMAFLRGMYGQPYADYYARARLQIAPVFRATPEIQTNIAQEEAAEAAAQAQMQAGPQPNSPAPDTGLTPPRDPPNDATNSEDSLAAPLKAALAQGKPVYAMKHVTPPRPAAAPAKLVKAKVYVLTDFGCASACIAFNDEMKLFPGAAQIGLETFVDNRTGTPTTHPLPTGNGVINVAIMTRDGRTRGDAAPSIPDYEFPGDINDTAAVQKWIAGTVLPRDGINTY